MQYLTISTHLITSVAFVVILGFVSTTFAGSRFTGLQMDDDAGVDIEVSSPFQELPMTGYAPVDIRISNHSGRTRHWRFRFTSNARHWHAGGTLDLLKSFTVENGADKRFHVAVPIYLRGAHNPHYNPGMQIQVSGYGIRSGNLQYSQTSGYTGKPRSPYLLMSDTLHQQYWGRLANHYKGAANSKKGKRHRGTDLIGSSFNPEELPGHWLGLSGVDCIWIAAADWAKLRPESRSALKIWLSSGGRLYICGTTIPESTLDDLGLIAGNGRWRYFLGKITWVRQSNKDLTIDDFASSLNKRANLYDQGVSRAVAGSWGLHDGVAARRINMGFIFGFLIVYGLVVGPINLFWQIRKKRHAHLFWSTPLISVSASVLLCLVILFWDGIGGKGRRFTAVYLMPNDNRSIIWQEQLSSTGVLLSQLFKTRDGVFAKPIPLDSNEPQWRRRQAAKRMKYTQAEFNYSGDWFRSRSLQGQFLQTVVATRGTVEILMNADDPQCRSSIKGTLDDFFYVDANERVWRAKNLRPGETRPLRETNYSELETWLTKLRHNPAILKTALARPEDPRNYFFAGAQTVDDLRLETSQHIRWSDEPVVFIGRAGNLHIPETATATDEHDRLNASAPAVAKTAVTTKTVPDIVRYSGGPVDSRSTTYSHQNSRSDSPVDDRAAGPAVIDNPHSRITRDQIYSTFQNMDDALQQKNLPDFLRYFADDVRIWFKETTGGRQREFHYRKKTYAQAMQIALRSMTDYRSERIYHGINIAEDGRTAEVRFTHREDWKTNGKPMRVVGVNSVTLSTTDENLSISRYDGRIIEYLDSRSSDFERKVENHE